MEKEIWGRVLSVRLRRLLAQQKHNIDGQYRHGYQSMVVRLGGKNRSVHSLVLETFCGPRPKGMVGMHLNGDPGDNRLSNLAWGTQQKNIIDSFITSRVRYCHAFERGADTLLIRRFIMRCEADEWAAEKPDCRHRLRQRDRRWKSIRVAIAHGTWIGNAMLVRL